MKAFARVTQNGEYPLFSKVNVNGANAHEVFKFLRYNSELYNKEDNTVGHIHWNFGKFLVDGPTGKQVTYHSSRGNLEDLEAMIKARLK